MSRDPIRSSKADARQVKTFPEANPYQDGSQEHSLWAAGHEQTASAIEASEIEGT
jgi:hypothetical protein